MPRPDKLRAHWEESDSEDEDSGSYNIPSPNVPSSQDEVPAPSLSQYQHEKLKKMLESLPRDSPSAEEFDEDEEGD
jgi:hypothetical protein